MRLLRSVEPHHTKIERKYKEEVELPEIHKRIKVLKDRSRDVLHKKPSFEEILDHSQNYMKQRKEELDHRIGERLS